MWPATEVGGGRVDEKTPAECFAAEQHAKAHLIAPRERHLGRPYPVHQGDVHQDDEPELSVAGRAAHPAFADDLRLDIDGRHGTALLRVDAEAREPATAVLQHFDVEGVDRGRTSASVDLHLDRGNPHAR